MANQLTTTVVEENDFVWCSFFLEADTLTGAPTDVTKQILIDASTLTTGITPTKLAVIKVTMVINGGMANMRLQHHVDGLHTGDIPILRTNLALSNSVTVVYPGDGLQGPTISGAVGDITLTTTGIANASESLHLIIEARKVP